VLSSDAGLLVNTANMQSEKGFPSSHQLKSYVASKSRLSSVVCNVRVPYSGGSNFRQYFYMPKFHGDRPRGTSPPGELNTRGVDKYSDF